MVSCRTTAWAILHFGESSVAFFYRTHAWFPNNAAIFSDWNRLPNMYELYLSCNFRYFSCFQCGFNPITGDVGWLKYVLKISFFSQKYWKGVPMLQFSVCMTVIQKGIKLMPPQSAPNFSGNKLLISTTERDKSFTYSSLSRAHGRYQSEFWQDNHTLSCQTLTS